MSATYPVELEEQTGAGPTGTGTTVDLDLADTSLRLWLEGTVAGGSPLTVFLEHSHSGNTWTPLGTFTALAAVGAERKVFPGAMRYVRARWTGGTGWSFTVKGEQALVYSTPADVRRWGLGDRNIPDDVTNEQIDATIEGADGLMDTYFRQAEDEDGLPLYAVPLEERGGDVRRASAIIAGYDIISAQVGYNPEQPNDDPFRIRYEDVIAWLREIAAGSATLEGLEPPEPVPGTTGRVLTITSEEPWGL